MATGAVLIMVGSAILTAAQNDSYLLGGRFLLGFGVSIGTSSAPMYALEMAPPRAYCIQPRFYHYECDGAAALLTALIGVLLRRMASSCRRLL